MYRHSVYKNIRKIIHTIYGNVIIKYILQQQCYGRMCVEHLCLYHRTWQILEMFVRFFKEIDLGLLIVSNKNVCVGADLMYFYLSVSQNRSKKGLKC